MLTSLQNSLVKQVRKLHATKYRRGEQVFLLEGTHLLEEAIASSWPIDVVCSTPQWQAKESALYEQILARSLRFECVSPEVLASMATTLNPDGVIAVARSRLLDCALSVHSLGLVLERIQDPGNVGTMLRTAAAAGVEGVLFDQESVDLESPKVLRASAGAWFRVATALYEDLAAQVRGYQNDGFQVVATAPRADLEYWAVDYTQPTLILIGNEGAGLSEELLEVATVQVSIPLSAGVESLNAATATGVMLFEAKRQRKLKGFMP